MPDIPDFTFKGGTFPMASVIEASQRKAQMEQQARAQNTQMTLQGIDAIGNLAQTLVNKRKKVAQALVLGKKFGMTEDESRAIGDPEMILKAQGIDKNMLPLDLIRGYLLRDSQGTPKITGAPPEAKPAATATPASESQPAATPSSGAMLTGGLGAPLPASAPAPLPPGVDTSTAPATAPTPVPIQAPPSRPPMVSKAVFDAVFKLYQANRPQSVFSYDNNGKITPVAQVPKGSLIEKDPNTASLTAKSFIGNDADGNPLFADKNGTITRGKVPVKPANPPATGGPVLPKSSTQPTATARSTSEFAKTVLPHFDSLRSLIQQADAKGYIGPAAGRLYGQFLAGKVGSTGNADADQLLGRLRATDMLLKSGTMKVHFGSRGGTNMYDHFSDMLNSGKQSAAVLNGSLDGMQEFIEGYAGVPNSNPVNSSPAPIGGTWTKEKEQEYQMLLDKKSNGSVKS